LEPTSALVKVDFPAFGRPTKAQKPERKLSFTGSVSQYGLAS
jgi:hypothetical protein